MVEFGSADHSKAGIIPSVRLQRLALAQALDLNAAETGTFYVVCRGGLGRLSRRFRGGNQVLCSGGACITDLMVKEGLVYLDFADVCSIMSETGTAMIGTGEAMGERRARRAAEAAIANPLLATAMTPPKRFVMEWSDAIDPPAPDRLSKGGGSLILAAGLSLGPRVNRGSGRNRAGYLCRQNDGDGYR